MTLSASSLELPLHGLVRLVPSLRDVAGRAVSRPLVWTSDNTAVASVDTSGVVTGSGVGNARVTATVDGVSQSVSIHVFVIDIASIAAGQSHSCALDQTGTVYCWGSTPTSFVSNSILPDRAPTPVPNAPTFTAVASGSRYSCGLTAAGKAYCWGWNGEGELGNGTTVNASSPTEVAGGHTFAAITAGLLHACALDMAGQAYCWGNNSSGELGNGQSTTGSLTPVAVATTQTLVAIDAGNSHTCAITVGGAAYCWGQNTSGQVGKGTVSLNEPTPVAVSDGHAFASVSVGWDHTCGVTADGVAYCWGENYWGQLGDGLGAATRRANPAPVRVTGDLAFRSVSAGRSFSCGLTTGGIGYCWGLGFNGQLGDGTDTNGRFAPSPAPIAGGLTFSAIDLGADHACAMSNLRTLYCWGVNTYGQLGNTLTSDTNVPVKVAGQP